VNRRVLVSIVIVAGFTLSLFSSCDSKPDVRPIGLRVDEVQPAFEELGFEFKRGALLSDQDHLIGVSHDGLAIVQLVGPPDSLLTARVRLQLRPGWADWSLQSEGFPLVKLIAIAAPEWRDGADWLAEKAPKPGRKGSSSITVNDVEITVRATKSPPTLAVILGDWSSPSRIARSKESETRNSGEKAEGGLSWGWKALIFLGVIFVATLITVVAMTIIEDKRKHRLHLDRFPLPSDEELKAFSKMIPKEQRLQLPVEEVTEEDLKAYRQEGFGVLERKGRSSFLRWGVSQPQVEEFIPGDEFKYLYKVMTRHNWGHLQAMKEFSEAGTEMSILGKDETILTKLSGQLFEKDETILTVQDPISIRNVAGILILTSKKILMDTVGYSGERPHGLCFVADYSRITSVETEACPGYNVFPPYWIKIGIGSDSYTFVTGKAVDQIKVKGIEKLIIERMGDQIYSTAADFDDVGIADLKDVEVKLGDLFKRPLS
jgi:hypothetical protein